MVVTGGRTAPLATITAGTFRVTGIIQTLVHKAILHSKEVAVKRIDILLRRPTEIAVVQNELAAILSAKCILGNKRTVRAVAAYAETYIANNEVLRAAAVDLVVRDDDAHAGCCLSGNSVILTIYTQVFG